MDLVCAFQIFTIWKVYSVNVYYIDILIFGFNNDYAQMYRKYIPISLSPSLYGALYKPSEMVGLVKKSLTLC